MMLETLKAEFERLKQDYPELNSLEYGEEKIGGIPTGNNAIILGVDEKLPKHKLWFSKRKFLPSHVLDIQTDVQESHTVVRSAQHIVGKKKARFIKNINQNWYGAEGPVVHVRGRMCALTNRHVAFRSGDVFTWEGQRYGAVLGVAPNDATVDAALISLEPAIASQTTPTGVYGVYVADTVNIGDVVFFNGPQSGYQYGIVKSIGLSAVYLPEGNILTFAASVESPVAGTRLSMPGDSGAPVYRLGYEGQIECVGMLFGSNPSGAIMRFVPMDQIWKWVQPFASWGTWRPPQADSDELKAQEILVDIKEGLKRFISGMQPQTYNEIENYITYDK